MYDPLQVGRTERVENSLNPNFSKAILVDYFFEELQKLKFILYDIDSPRGSLKSADFLGEMECTLGQVGHTCLIGNHIITSIAGFQSVDKSL